MGHRAIHGRQRGRSYRWLPALLALAVFASRSGQAQTTGTPRVTIAAGLNRGVDYHAPIASRGRLWSQSAAVGVGPRLGHRLVVPRVTASYHAALAERSDMWIARLEIEGIASLSRSELMVPFLGAGVAAYAGQFDACDLVPAPVGACSGNRSGVGWQATAGLLFPADTGPSAAINVSYLVNRKAYDAVAVTLSLTL